MVDLGDKIQVLRKKSKLTQEKLAEKINVSRQTVYKWEKNEAQPTYDNIQLLCEFFKVEANYFFTDEEINGENFSEIAVTSVNRTTKKLKVLKNSAIILGCIVGVFTLLILVLIVIALTPPTDQIETVNAVILVYSTEFLAVFLTYLICIIAFVSLLTIYIVRKKQNVNKN